MSSRILLGALASILLFAVVAFFPHRRTAIGGFITPLAEGRYEDTDE